MEDFMFAIFNDNEICINGAIFPNSPIYILGSMASNTLLQVNLKIPY